MAMADISNTDTIRADRRELSLRLYDVLEMVGASERMRKLHNRVATKSEILSESAHCYLCGSSYEGTVSLDLASDIDLIMCSTSIPVVLHRLMAGPGLSLLMVRDSWTYSGYVKLQFVDDGRPLTFECLGEGDSWTIDRAGRACTPCRKDVSKHGPGVGRQGPAIMFVNKKGKHYLDLVTAFKCNGIPLYATKWITRHRSYGWPSQQLLDDMRTMGCMVVGMGYFDSPEKDIEWRLSFPLQERKLMKSLNSVQHKVYIILKMIKKSILEKCLKIESLSSYHCKTCVFHIVEMTPACVWTRNNLINCLIQCLKLLLRWLRNKYCPSFFMKEQNLFNKEGFLILMEPLRRLILLLIRTGHQFLYMLKNDRVGEMLWGGVLQLYRPMTDLKVNRYIFDMKNELIGRISGRDFSNLLQTRFKENALSYFMTQLQHEHEVSGHTMEESKVSLQYKQPWLNLRIGMEFAALAITYLNIPESKKFMKKADYHLQRARNTDLVNTRLVQASILFRFEQFEECFLLLEEIENCWNGPVVTWCICTGGISPIPARNAQELYDRYPRMQNIPVTKLMKNHIATCVKFLPSQTKLVPTPLQYEMCRSLGTLSGSRDKDTKAWFSWVVVDAKVYMYFMQYLVCSKLNREPHRQNAMENLASLIQEDNHRFLHHTETAYNLLGWIYLQEHHVANAVQCFLKSWKLRPHHNAAKFHLWSTYVRLSASYTLS